MEEAELPLTDGIIFNLSSLHHPVHRPVDRRLQWRKVYASKVVFVDSWSTNCLIWTKHSPQPHQLLPPDLHRVAEIENWDWFKFNIGGVQPEGWLWCNSNTESCRWGARERVSSRPCSWPTWSPPRSSPSPSLNFSCYSFVRAPAFSFVRSYLVSGTTQTNLLLAGGQNFIICVFAFSQGLLAFWQPLLFSLVLSCFFTWLEKLSASWNLSSVYFPCFWLPGFCLCCFLCSCFWCSCFQRLLFLAVEWLWLHWSRPAGVPLTLAPAHLHRSAMHKTKLESENILSLHRIWSWKLLEAAQVSIVTTSCLGGKTAAVDELGFSVTSLNGF